MNAQRSRGIDAGSILGPGSGGGSGPYSPTTFSSNAVLLGNGTGAIQASGITSTAGGSGLTAAASTDLTLNAGSGANNNVVLAPVGTGQVRISGHTLLGGLTTDGTGVLQLPAATTSAGGIGLGTDSSLFTTGAGALQFQKNSAGNASVAISSNGANIITILADTGTGGYVSTSGSLFFRSNGVTTALTIDTSQNATFAKLITSYNGITTAGLGVPVIVASTNISAQSAAATITSYANPATDADFDVRAQMSVTASTTLVTTLTCTYTDVANVARTMILPVVSVSGTFVAAGAITGAGASIWETPVMHIRAKASTTITLLTSTGTFSGVTYSASGIITKLNG